MKYTLSHKIFNTHTCVEELLNTTIYIHIYIFQIKHFFNGSDRKKYSKRKCKQKEIEEENKKKKPGIGAYKKEENSLSFLR